MELNVNSMQDSPQGIYSEFCKNRIVFVTGAIDDALAQDVIMRLLAFDSLSNDEIRMYINSPGGSVSAGLAIYDCMQHVASPVSTLAIGMAASMGAFLLLAGEPGRRFALPNAQVLIHQPLGEAAGQATEIQIAAERIIETRKRVSAIMAKHIGKSIESIERDTERDRWMWAEHAVEYGIIDEVKRPG